MRKTRIASALACLLALPGVAAAQDSPHTLTGNVGLFSQYIFRGLTQTNEELAIQGGLDYAHSSGIYVGTWGSNVSWLRDNGSYDSGGSAEIDFYGGFKNAIGATGITYDVGLLYYYYPGSAAPGFIKANTFEAYAGLGWKWFSVKYSYSLRDETFGVNDSKGSNYWDFGVVFPVAETGLTLGAHYGIQTYRGTDPANLGGGSNDDTWSYDDWKVSAAYDLGKLSKVMSGVEVGAMYTDTNGASVCGYGSGSEVCAPDVSGPYVNAKNVAQDQVTVWLKKTF
jgi:uncharacterized protein (TIGR02001 family)